MNYLKKFNQYLNIIYQNLEVGQYQAHQFFQKSYHLFNFIKLNIFDHGDLRDNERLFGYLAANDASFKILDNIFCKAYLKYKDLTNKKICRFN